MAKQYRWKTDATIISGGYPGEETGIISGSTDWNTTEVVTGESTASYFFRDSAHSDNAWSSRVVVSVTDKWVATINNRNLLSVTLETTVNSIYRDDIRNIPSQGGSRYREMYIRRVAGETVPLWSIQNDDIDTAHNILGSPLVFPTYTFTIQPGEMASRGSIYFLSSVQGHANDPLPNIYTDVMWLGVNFQNILPADYRPGQRKVNGEWLSLNRVGGVCDRKGYGEMRTTAGGTDNPPSIKRNGVWYNQNLIGKE